MHLLEDFQAFADLFAKSVETSAIELEARLHELSEEVGAVAASGDTGRMAQLRSRVERLRRRVERDQSGELAGRAGTSLAAVAAMLAAARVEARLHAVAQQSHAEIPVLRDRIVAAVRDEPLRPRDLVAAFGTDGSQVSRALGELMDAESVVEVDPPDPKRTDGRARWYRAVEPVLREQPVLADSPARFGAASAASALMKRQVRVRVARRKALSGGRSGGIRHFRISAKRGSKAERLTKVHRAADR